MAKRRMIDGRPRKYDGADLAIKMEKYINETEIPIIAEFAYQNNIPKARLYEQPELDELLKKCTAKKEAALERKSLAGEVNTTQAIFSLKQLGWRDKQQHELTGADGGPIVVKLPEELGG
jgi:hypothetical protein